LESRSEYAVSSRESVDVVELEKLRAELSDARSSHDQLLQEIGVLRASVSERDLVLTLASEEVDGAKGALVVLSHQLRELRSSLEAAKDERGLVDAELEDVRARLLQSDLARLNAENQRDDSVAMLDSLRVQLRASETSLSDAQRTIDSQTVRLSELSDRLLESEETASRLVSRYESLLSSSGAASQSSVEKLREVLFSVGAQLRSLRGAHSDWQSECLSDVNRCVSGLDSLWAAVACERDRHRSLVVDLESRVRELENQLSVVHETHEQDEVEALERGDLLGRPAVAERVVHLEFLGDPRVSSTRDCEVGFSDSVFTADFGCMFPDHFWGIVQPSSLSLTLEALENEVGHLRSELMARDLSLVSLEDLVDLSSSAIVLFCDVICRHSDVFSRVERPTCDFTQLRVTLLNLSSMRSDLFSAVALDDFLSLCEMLSTTSEHPEVVVFSTSGPVSDINLSSLPTYVESDFSELENARACIGSLRSRLQSELQSHEEEVNQLQISLADVERQLAEKETELDDAFAELKAQRAELESSMNLYLEKAEELDATRVKLNTLEAQYNINRDISTQNRDLGGAFTERSELIESGDTKPEIELRQTVKTFQDYEGETNYLNEQLVSARQQLTKLQNELDAAITETAQLRCEQDALNLSVLSLTEERKRLNQLYEEMNANHSLCEQQKCATERRLTNVAENLQKLISRLQKSHRLTFASEVHWEAIKSYLVQLVSEITTSAPPGEDQFSQILDSIHVFERGIPETSPSVTRHELQQSEPRFKSSTKILRGLKPARSCQIPTSVCSAALFEMEGKYADLCSVNKALNQITAYVDDISKDVTQQICSSLNVLEKRLSRISEMHVRYNDRSLSKSSSVRSTKVSTGPVMMIEADSVYSNVLPLDSTSAYLRSFVNELAILLEAPPSLEGLETSSCTWECTRELLALVEDLKERYCIAQAERSRLTSLLLHIRDELSEQQKSVSCLHERLIQMETQVIEERLLNDMFRNMLNNIQTDSNDQIDTVATGVAALDPNEEKSKTHTAISGKGGLSTKPVVTTHTVDFAADSVATCPTVPHVIDSDTKPPDISSLEKGGTEKIKPPKQSSEHISRGRPENDDDEQIKRLDVPYSDFTTVRTTAGEGLFRKRTVQAASVTPFVGEVQRDEQIISSTLSGPRVNDSVEDEFNDGYSMTLVMCPHCKEDSRHIFTKPLSMVTADTTFPAGKDHVPLGDEKGDQTDCLLRFMNTVRDYCEPSLPKLELHESSGTIDSFSCEVERLLDIAKQKFAQQDAQVQELTDLRMKYIQKETEHTSTIIDFQNCIEQCKELGTENSRLSEELDHVCSSYTSQMSRIEQMTEMLTAVENRVGKYIHLLGSVEPEKIRLTECERDVLRNELDRTKVQLAELEKSRAEQFAEVNLQLSHQEAVTIQVNNELRRAQQLNKAWSDAARRILERLNYSIPTDTVVPNRKESHDFEPGDLEQHVSTTIDSLQERLVQSASVDNECNALRTSLLETQSSYDAVQAEIDVIRANLDRQFEEIQEYQYLWSSGLTKVMQLAGYLPVASEGQGHKDDLSFDQQLRSQSEVRRTQLMQLEQIVDQTCHILVESGYYPSAGVQIERQTSLPLTSVFEQNERFVQIPVSPSSDTELPLYSPGVVHSIPLIEAAEIVPESTYSVVAGSPDSEDWNIGSSGQRSKSYMIPTQSSIQKSNKEEEDGKILMEPLTYQHVIGQFKNLLSSIHQVRFHIQTLRSDFMDQHEIIQENLVNTLQKHSQLLSYFRFSYQKSALEDFAHRITLCLRKLQTILPLQDADSVFEIDQSGLEEAIVNLEFYVDHLPSITAESDMLQLLPSKPLEAVVVQRPQITKPCVGLASESKLEVLCAFINALGILVQPGEIHQLQTLLEECQVAEELIQGLNPLLKIVEERFTSGETDDIASDEPQTTVMQTSLFDFVDHVAQVYNKPALSSDQASQVEFQARLDDLLSLITVEQSKPSDRSEYCLLLSSIEDATEFVRFLIRNQVEIDVNQIKGEFLDRISSTLKQSDHSDVSSWLDKFTVLLSEILTLNDSIVSSYGSAVVADELAGAVNEWTTLNRSRIEDLSRIGQQLNIIETTQDAIQKAIGDVGERLGRITKQLAHSRLEMDRTELPQADAKSGLTEKVSQLEACWSKFQYIMNDFGQRIRSDLLRAYEDVKLLDAEVIMEQMGHGELIVRLNEVITSLSTPGKIEFGLPDPVLQDTLTNAARALEDVVASFDLPTVCPDSKPVENDRAAPLTAQVGKTSCVSTLQGPSTFTPEKSDDLVFVTTPSGQLDTWMSSSTLRLTPKVARRARVTRSHSAPTKNECITLSSNFPSIEQLFSNSMPSLTTACFGKTGRTPYVRHVLGIELPDQRLSLLRFITALESYMPAFLMQSPDELQDYILKPTVFRAGLRKLRTILTALPDSFISCSLPKRVSAVENRIRLVQLRLRHQLSVLRKQLTDCTRYNVSQSSNLDQTASMELHRRAKITQLLHRISLGYKCAHDLLPTQNPLHPGGPTCRAHPQTGLARQSTTSLTFVPGFFEFESTRGLLARQIHENDVLLRLLHLRDTELLYLLSQDPCDNTSQDALEGKDQVEQKLRQFSDWSRVTPVNLSTIPVHRVHVNASGHEKDTTYLQPRPMKPGTSVAHSSVSETRGIWTADTLMRRGPFVQEDEKEHFILDHIRRARAALTQMECHVDDHISFDFEARLEPFVQPLVELVQLVRPQLSTSYVRTGTTTAASDSRGDRSQVAAYSLPTLGSRSPGYPRRLTHPPIPELINAVDQLDELKELRDLAKYLIDQSHVVSAELEMQLDMNWCLRQRLNAANTQIDEITRLLNRGQNSFAYLEERLSIEAGKHVTLTEQCDVARRQAKKASHLLDGLHEESSDIEERMRPAHVTGSTSMGDAAGTGLNLSDTSVRAMPVYLVPQTNVVSVSSQTEKITKASCLNCGPGRRRSPSDKLSRRPPRAVPHASSHRTPNPKTNSASLPQVGGSRDTPDGTRISEQYVMPSSSSQTNNSALSLVMRSDRNWPNEFSPADSDYLLQPTTFPGRFEMDKSGKFSSSLTSSSSTMRAPNSQLIPSVPVAVTTASSCSEREQLISDWSESATATTTLTRTSAITATTTDTVVTPTSSASLPSTQSQAHSDPTSVSSGRQKMKKQLFRLITRQKRAKQSPKP
ncbi:hypothetical protein D915_006285, partial [Fasciola hepatica]